MRRLAKQSRDDTYSSYRDYQTLHTRQGLRIKPLVDGQFTLALEAMLSSVANTTYIAFGGFFFPSTDLNLGVELEIGSVKTFQNFSLGKRWNRVGIVVDAPQAIASLSADSLDDSSDASDSSINDREIMVRLTWTASATISFWGVTAGAVNLPSAALDERPDPAYLRQSHLSPETFYLPHDEALALDINAEQSSKMQTEVGDAVTVKKCSYCGRLLPLDPNELGSLSFHKHNAKKTHHQNECRVCKAWRINKEFNPMRTTDQLHESSVITRERQIFLRDPEILQQIKDRTGAGLKSQVWERFGRKCFHCGRPLEIEDVQLDHTRPMAYLWPIDEHATCLCAEHNNQKKDKFPVEFYSDEQLRRLSAICGMPYAKLREKQINEVQLQRMLANLPFFARRWGSRTFTAIARKIRELQPTIDLHARLREMDAEAYTELFESGQERPPAIGESTTEMLHPLNPHPTLFDFLDETVAN